MKLYLSIVIFFFSSVVVGQNKRTRPSQKERLYREIAVGYDDEIKVIRGMGFEQQEFWNKLDSFFGSMPLNTALRYYQDSTYCIKYYSFLKILGQNDTLAFELLKQYISDSTQIMYEVGDIGEFQPFNKILANAYESFISSKYFWCDSKTDNKYYFRKNKFAFTKYNYSKWPSILTEFIELIAPWNIEHANKLEDLKNYHGVDYFYGR